MSSRIKLICVGRMKSLAPAADEYVKRLRGHIKLEIADLPEERLKQEPSRLEIDAALKKEARFILSSIPDRTMCAALCIEGRQLSSEDFAELCFPPAGGLCLVIGGSYGLHEDVKRRADLLLSMSKMTFPHHLARVMLLEQIYRAAMIRQGGRYHK